MNCETCQLKELDLEPTEIRDVLRSSDPTVRRNWSISLCPLCYIAPANGYAKYDCAAGILHTVFFHRTLSLVRPKDVDCKFLEITYVQCGLPELEKEIDEKIEQFIAWVEKHPNRRSQVCLSFFDEKSKNPAIPIIWNVRINILQNMLLGNALVETSSRHAALESSINEVLFQIINFANEKKDHIPAIPDRIFNHEIMIPR
nr:unnamed protein product [Digitaria exilis]